MRVSTFLMFTGEAEAAATFYQSLFPDAVLEKLVYFKATDSGPEGKVREAVLMMGGHRLILFDSPVQHQFSFTPSTSFYVECESGEEVERLATALGEGGGVLMPVDSYDFAVRYAWVTDRYGVSWQLCHESR